jgi:hypothetical protein
VLSSRIAPSEMRGICDSINDDHGVGGQSKLARLLGWHHSTVWQKINCKSAVTRNDELTISHVHAHSLFRQDGHVVKKRRVMTIVFS